MDTTKWRRLLLLALVLPIWKGTPASAGQYPKPSDGPVLVEESKVIRAELKGLSRSKLLEIVVSPQSGEQIDAIRAQEALGELANRGMDVDTVDKLVERAKKSGEGGFSTTILQTLARPVYESKASPTQKACVDRLVDLLEEDLKKGGESALGSNAAEALGRLLYRGPRRLVTTPPREETIELPYAHARIINVLIASLDNPERKTRMRVIDTLGWQAGNDPQEAENVIAVLQRQREREMQSHDYGEDNLPRAYVLERRADALRQVESAIERIRKRVAPRPSNAFGQRVGYE